MRPRLSFLPRVARGVRALAFPHQHEDDAFILLSRISQYLQPRYRLPSPAVDWLCDASFTNYQQVHSVTPATAHRHLALRSLAALVRDIEGDTVECGSYRGASSSLILEANERDAPERNHHIFDSFQGLSTPGEFDGNYWSRQDLSASEDDLRGNLGNRRYQLYSGWIPERFNEVATEEFCFVHIDVDLHQPTKDSLRFFYPRLAMGGIILCDDYGSSRCRGATRACDDFTAQQGLPGFAALPAGGGFIIKSRR